MRSVDRALAVLECFSREQRTLTLAQIARSTGLPKSTALRFLRALEARKYLKQIDSDKFVLGAKVRKLASVFSSATSVHKIAGPLLEGLAQKADETVTLNAIVGSHRVCVDVKGDRFFSGVPHIGQRAPLNLGGASLALLAFQTDETASEILPLAARRAACTRQELRSILSNVRRQGYAISHGGGTPGVSGISAPIFQPDGSVTHCVTVLVPTTRVRGHVAALTDLVRRTAGSISQQLQQI